MRAARCHSAVRDPRHHPLGRSITLSEVLLFLQRRRRRGRMAASRRTGVLKETRPDGGALRTELPESASPIVPKRWSELNTITIAFGHGIAVAPLQAVMGINAVVNAAT